MSPFPFLLSQHNHHLLREVYNIGSLIPAVHGRPTDALPTNRWRYLMATAFDEETYGQRWQVETVMFMLKHHQGAALTAHTYHTRRREMGLVAVTHNIMILRLIKLFYRGLPTPFFSEMLHKPRLSRSAEPPGRDSGPVQPCDVSPL